MFRFLMATMLAKRRPRIGQKTLQSNNNRRKNKNNKNNKKKKMMKTATMTAMTTTWSRSPSTTTRSRTRSQRAHPRTTSRVINIIYCLLNIMLLYSHYFVSNKKRRCGPAAPRAGAEEGQVHGGGDGEAWSDQRDAGARVRIGVGGGQAVEEAGRGHHGLLQLWIHGGHVERVHREAEEDEDRGERRGDARQCTDAYQSRAGGSGCQGSAATATTAAATTAAEYSADDATAAQADASGAKYEQVCLTKCLR